MAGRLHLEAGGSGSLFLSKEPNFSYFTTIHKKQTHFCVENVVLETETEFNFDQVSNFKIPSNCGDLLNKIYLKVTLPKFPTIPGGYDQTGNYDPTNVGSGDPDSYGVYSNGFQPVRLFYTESIGHALIDYIEIKIGGQMIERLTGENLQMYSEISDTQGKQLMNKELIGKFPYEFNITPTSHSLIALNMRNYRYSQIPENVERDLYINIPFYFYNNPELYLPICSIYKQEIEIEVKFRNIHDLVVEYILPNRTSFQDSWGITKPRSEFNSYIENLKISDVKCNAEVTFLDNIEKIKVKQRNVDYLTSELQLNSFRIDTQLQTIPKKSFNLSFKNPVKELYFFIQRENVHADETNRADNDLTGTTFVTPFDYDNSTPRPLIPTHGYSTSAIDTNLVLDNLKELSLSIDGEEVISKTLGKPQFLRVIQPSIHHNRVPMTRKVYMYSFALKPEDWRPSGHIDFTSIKNQLLDITLYSSDAYIKTIHVPGPANGNPSSSFVGWVTFPRNIRVYAKSYNILRVKDGMAQKLF
jgi:hypothetical protein